MLNGGDKKWWGSKSCSSLSSNPGTVETSYLDGLSTQHEEPRSQPASNSVCLRVCPIVAFGDDEEVPFWEWREGREHGELYQLERGVKAALPSFRGAVYGPDAKTETIFKDNILEVRALVNSKGFAQRPYSGHHRRRRRGRCCETSIGHR